MQVEYCVCPGGGQWISGQHECQTCGFPPAAAIGRCHRHNGVSCDRCEVEVCPSQVEIRMVIELPDPFTAIYNAMASFFDNGSFRIRFDEGNLSVHGEMYGLRRFFRGGTFPVVLDAVRQQRAKADVAANKHPRGGGEDDVKISVPSDNGDFIL